MEGRDRGSQEQVEFSHEGHTYITVAGEDRPSLHLILETANLMDTRWYKPEYADRGIAVHELTALLDKDLLRIEDIDPEYQGYCEGWLQFKEDLKPEIIDIEKPVGHKIYKYACTPDRTSKINGKSAIIDIKSGQPEKWHGVQVVAQAIATGLTDAALYGVYLKKNGKYKLETYLYRDHFNVWMAALTVYHYKKGG